MLGASNVTVAILLEVKWAFKERRTSSISLKPARNFGIGQWPLVSVWCVTTAAPSRQKAPNKRTKNARSEPFGLGPTFVYVDGVDRFYG